jgi:hypothetical protein
VLWIVKDRLGRSITLTEERWRHIVQGHVALDGHHLAIKAALEKADEIGRGNSPGSELIYGRDLGPARWLAVVVACERKTGFIVTAYPQNKDPRITGTDRPTEGS